MSAKERSREELNGGHDIGVMNRLAADLNVFHQLDKLTGNGGGIVGHLKMFL